MWCFMNLKCLKTIVLSNCFHVGLIWSQNSFAVQGKGSQTDKHTRIEWGLMVGDHIPIIENLENGI